MRLVALALENRLNLCEKSASNFLLHLTCMNQKDAKAAKEAVSTSLEASFPSSLKRMIHSVGVRFGKESRSTRSHSRIRFVSLEEFELAERKTRLLEETREKALLLGRRI